MSILSRIGDLLYEKDPDYVSRTIRTPPTFGSDIELGPGGMAQQGVRITPDGPLYPPIDFGSQDVDVSTIGEKRSNRKSKLGKFVTEALPRIVQGGIAAAATPNIAGGGPTDIFRAMQAGGDAVRSQDIAQYEMQRRRQRDAMDAAKTQSDIEQNNAQSDMYRAHQKAYEAEAGKDESMVVTLPPGAAIVDKKSGRELYRNPASEPRPTILGVGQVAIGPDGKQVAKGPDKVEEKKAAPKPWRNVVQDGNGNVTVIEEKPDGQYGSTTIKGVGKVAKPAGSTDKKPQATPAQFATVEHRKNQSFMKAKQRLERRIADASKGMAGNPGAIDPATKQTLMQDYNDEMSLAQQAYEAEIRALGGSVGEKPAAATGGGSPTVQSQPRPAVTPKAGDYLKRRGIF